jgi:hypothetical protein
MHAWSNIGESSDLWIVEWIVITLNSQLSHLLLLFIILRGLGCRMSLLLLLLGSAIVFICTTYHLHFYVDVKVMSRT